MAGKPVAVSIIRRAGRDSSPSLARRGYFLVAREGLDRPEIGSSGRQGRPQFRDLASDRWRQEPQAPPRRSWCSAGLPPAALTTEPDPPARSSGAPMAVAGPYDAIGCSRGFHSPVRRRPGARRWSLSWAGSLSALFDSAAAARRWRSHGGSSSPGEGGGAHGPLADECMISNATWRMIGSAHSGDVSTLRQTVNRGLDFGSDRCAMHPHPACVVDDEICGPALHSLNACRSGGRHGSGAIALRSLPNLGA